MNNPVDIIVTKNNMSKPEVTVKNLGETAIELFYGSPQNPGKPIPIGAKCEIQL